jgi:hypothetical protein
LISVIGDSVAITVKWCRTEQLGEFELEEFLWASRATRRPVLFVLTEERWLGSWIALCKVVESTDCEGGVQQ